MSGAIPSAVPVVFVVDDDLSVREGLSALVRSAGWRVEAFCSGAEFLREKPSAAPCCVVLDVGLPGLSGMEIQRRLATAHRPIPIIFITGQGDIPTAVQAMKAGAVEFLTKPFHEGDLLKAIEHALTRDRQALARRGEAEGLQERLQTLTRRERDVMALVVRGLMNKEVAGELGIREITVKTHRGRAMRKMQAASLADLVRMAARLERES